MTYVGICWCMFVCTVYNTSCMHVWLLFDIDRWSLRDAFETNVLAPAWFVPSA